MSTELPLLTVLMPAYNHGRFIAHALEGCLMQQTDFPYQIIVCDDCSRDNTREIVDAYAEKHPNIIRLYQPVNSKGANNLIEGLKHVNTKYLAMCEGDDYWTDPLKLQKQVDFLENHPKFNVASHRVKIVYEEGIPHSAGSFVYKDIKSKKSRIRKGIFYPDEVMANYYFHTSSLVFRWLFMDGLPPWFAKRMVWDHFLFLLHAHNSMIKYFDEPMSCWRHHSAGWTFLQNIDKNIFFSYSNDSWNEVYDEMDKYFGYRYTPYIKERKKLSLTNALEFCLKHDEIGRLRSLVNDSAAMIQSEINDNPVFRQAWNIIRPANRVFVLPWTAKKKDKAAGVKKQIGGFRPLPLQYLPESADSVWQAWVGEREHACFATVNQAIMRWLYECRVERVWMPSFYDPLVDSLRNAAQFFPIFYECGRNLQPDPAIAAQVMPGEGIITPAWFGAPTPERFQNALMARPGIFWIEDRRHALRIDEESKANAVVYSAPDVLGMPDGGIIVGKGCAGIDSDLPWTAGEVFTPGLKYRSEAYNAGTTDASMRHGYAAERERAFFPGSACSKFTIQMLKCLEMEPLAAQVRENFLTLYESLDKICFWQQLPEPLDFVPYAFPAIFPNALFPHITVDIAQALLHNVDILCFRKWHPLAVEQLNRWHYSGSQLLSRELLLIPCDWRYNRSDLELVASACQQEFDGFEARFR